MRIAFSVFVLIHALLHLPGFAKAFHLAQIPQLRQTISPGLGAAWLTAAVILAAAAVMLAAGSRSWWVPALVGVGISQLLILGNWADARAGSVANAVLLVPILVAAADLRPSSLRSRYRDATASAMAASPDQGAAPLVAEADLAGLPAPVARWLRRVGVIGRPRVRRFQARFEAAIRDGPGDRWMAGTAEQRSFTDPPTRLFFMDLTRAGVPVDVYHRYAPDGATMEARVAGLVPVVDESGPVMARAETVTFLNDVFLLAPGAVPFMGFTWEELGPGRIRVRWENQGHRVSAVLSFDDAGDLVDFESRDRVRLHGGVGEPLLWSTPVASWQEFDGRRLLRSAEARWGEGPEAWSYARMELRDIGYDPR